jgi:hypothetical protein
MAIEPFDERTEKDATRPRDPELARAEAEVERSRARVAESVLALRREVARRTDWRSWIARRPLAFLAGALALGVWWGYGSARRDIRIRKGGRTWK